jgi:crossover junction endodeoxyribonuclease RuvC
VKILGIDPGLDNTGYAYIEWEEKFLPSSPFENMKLCESGLIKTKPKMNFEERLSQIHSQIKKVISRINPDVIVIEDLYSHYKHPTTAIKMGHARGVIELVAGEKGVKLCNYPVTRVRKAILGRGNASKQQVIKAVTQMLNIKDGTKSEHECDALALSLSYILIYRKKKKLNDIKVKG